MSQLNFEFHKPVDEAYTGALVNPAAESDYASDEERYFSWYLAELVDGGFVESWNYEPYTYRLSPIQKYSVTVQLKTRVTQKRLSLFQSHNYTPDFGVLFTSKAKGLIYNFITDGVDLRTAPFIANLDEDTGKAYSIIEVKPSFDRNNMIRLFRLNQKWLYANRKVYVQEVVPVKFFEKSFTPAKYLVTPIGRARTLHYEPKTLMEYKP